MFGWETYTREAGYAINTLFVKQNWPPQGWNTMFYTNSKVEELNTQASQEVDSTKRLAYLQEALKLIMQDAPWIPLFTYKQFNAQDKKLKGVVMYPTQIPRFEKAYFE